MKTTTRLLAFLLTLACLCFGQTARATYDPTMGRFLSFDPLGHGGSMDGYSFCDGDPCNKWDADGRFGKQIANDYQNLVDNLTEARSIADSQITYADSDFHYADEDQDIAAQWSAFVDMVPIVGGLKQWTELNTGKDMFTGQWMQGNQYLQALGIVGNFAPVAFGPAGLLEGGGESAFFGAGERGLIEDAELELGASEANILRGVNFTEGQAIVEGAEFNMADFQANGTYGGGAFAGSPAAGFSATSGNAGVAAEGTAADSQMITVLGSGRDVAPYVGQPGFNTFTGAGIPAAELDTQNALWLNNAIQRGDQIWLVTDPAAHQALMNQLNLQSAYLNLELPMMGEYSGVNAIPKFVPPTAGVH